MRPSLDSPMVAAAEARAAVTRAEAERWAWVRDRWSRDPAAYRAAGYTTPPDRYTWPRGEFMLVALGRMRLLPPDWSTRRSGPA